MPYPQTNDCTQYFFKENNMNGPNIVSSIDGDGASTDSIEDALPGDARIDPVCEKLSDAQTPGYRAEFDPAEADAAGAFPEDALTEADALASMHDDLHFGRLPSLPKQ